MPTNPYTRLKDETDAKIAALTEQNAAFRKENKALEESWNKVLADLSMARQRILALEHALYFARLLADAAGLAANYLARSWFTGGKGRTIETQLFDACDLFVEAHKRSSPNPGYATADMFGKQGFNPNEPQYAQFAAAKKKD